MSRARSVRDTDIGWRLVLYVTVKFFENMGVRAVGVSFREPHHKKVHLPSNAPWAVNRGLVQAERGISAKEVVFGAVLG